jgi:hypothetical protein
MNAFDEFLDKLVGVTEPTPTSEDPLAADPADMPVVQKIRPFSVGPTTMLVANGTGAAAAPATAAFLAWADPGVDMIITDFRVASDGVGANQWNNMGLRVTRNGAFVIPQVQNLTVVAAQQYTRPVPDWAQCVTFPWKVRSGDVLLLEWYNVTGGNIYLFWAVGGWFTTSI